MKGDMSIMHVIFAILLGALLIFVLTRTSFAPSISSYGDAQARILARSIATSANALGVAYEGMVSQSFKNPWDIKVVCDDECWVRVTHGKYDSGKVKTLVPVQENEIRNTVHVVVYKYAGENVAVDAFLNQGGGSGGGGASGNF